MLKIENYRLPAITLGVIASFALIVPNAVAQDEEAAEALDPSLVIGDGDVFDLPIPQPHCSANMGMRIKLTCSISGAKIK